MLNIVVLFLPGPFLLPVSAQLIIKLPCQTQTRAPHPEHIQKKDSKRAIMIYTSHELEFIQQKYFSVFQET